MISQGCYLSQLLHVTMVMYMVYLPTNMPYIYGVFGYLFPLGRPNEPFLIIKKTSRFIGCRFLFLPSATAPSRCGHGFPASATQGRHAGTTFPTPGKTWSGCIRPRSSSLGNTTSATSVPRFELNAAGGAGWTRGPPRHPLGTPSGRHHCWQLLFLVMSILFLEM